MVMLSATERPLQFRLGSRFLLDPYRSYGREVVPVETAVDRCGLGGRGSRPLVRWSAAVCSVSLRRDPAEGRLALRAGSTATASW